jgi:hypothetical protein
MSPSYTLATDIQLREMFRQARGIFEIQWHASETLRSTMENRHEEQASVARGKQH